MGLFILILLGGTLFFMFEYVTKAQQWVAFTGSPHVYNNSNIGTEGDVASSHSLRLLSLLAAEYAIGEHRRVERAVKWHIVPTVKDTYHLCLLIYGQAMHVVTPLLTQYGVTIAHLIAICKRSSISYLERCLPATITNIVHGVALLASRINNNMQLLAVCCHIIQS